MSALLKLIATAAIATAIASPSIAGSWIKVERPCGSRCAAPQPTTAMSPSECCAVGSVRFRDLTKAEVGRPIIMVGASNPQVYETRSRTIVRSNYGTSVIDGVYRSYSR